MTRFSAKSLNSLLIAIPVLFITLLFGVAWLVDTRLDRLVATQQEESVELRETLKIIQDTLQQANQGNQAKSAAISATPSPAASLSAVFDLSVADSENTTKINELKEHFESLFVTYQYLLKCQLAEESDYHMLNSILVHQMASLNAQGRIQYDILTAAKGTFDEIYARSSCESPDIENMHQQFRNYLSESQKNRFLM